MGRFSPAQGVQSGLCATEIKNSRIGIGGGLYRVITRANRRAVISISRRRTQVHSLSRNEPRETQRPEWRGAWGTGARGRGVVSAASARKIPRCTITRIMLSLQRKSHSFLFGLQRVRDGTPAGTAPTSCRLDNKPTAKSRGASADCAQPVRFQDRPVDRIQGSQRNNHTDHLQ